MADTPDISQIINLIMQNPELIATVTQMLKGGDNSEGEPAVTDEPVAVNEPDERRTDVGRTGSGRHQNRTRLLNAMKPYLSEKRRGAIDTMITLSDILEAMSGR